MQRSRFLIALLVLAVPSGDGRGAEPKAIQAAAKTKTRNVFLVTSDGLRWQEVFGGADLALTNKENGGVADPAVLTKEFGGDTPEIRRKLLMPFVWDVIAKKGQLFGDARAGSDVKVTNGKNFSYPGYNEIFTGAADPQIDSNDKIPNRNVTVLEWLNGRDEFRGRVAAFGSWDVFPYILNQSRSKLPVVAGWEPLTGGGRTGEESMIGRLLTEMPRLWPDCCYDCFTFHAAFLYLKRQRPRILYIGLGETDEFAHAGQYDQYLRSAHRVDDYLRRLWETAQSLPDYRDTTTLVVTADHGRGNAPLEWKSHGDKIPGSERIWIAVIGPDTPGLGNRIKHEPLTQSQLAATIAALLGLDYRAFAPKAAPPIKDVLPGSATDHLGRMKDEG
ncbi:MAG: sulfatase-like hydrolase/transferase [Isosphaerales bacterium]